MSTNLAEPARRLWRRFLRFRMLGMIVVVLVMGGGLGWLVRGAHIQRDAVAAVERAGGSVLYNWQFHDVYGYPEGKPWAPMWPVDFVGVDHFGRVKEVWLVQASEPVLAQVGRLPTLVPSNRRVWLTYLAMPRCVLIERGAPNEGLNACTVKRATEPHLTEDPDLTLLKTLDPSLERQPPKGFENIIDLKLSSTNITDEQMKAVAKAKKLRMLDLSSTSISDVGLRQISELGALGYLDVADTNVTDEPLGSLRNLQGIVVLRLDGTKLRSGEGALSWLRLCKTLSILSLNRTALRDTDLRRLAECKTLSELELNDTALSGSFLEYCKALPRLSKVGVRGNKRFLGSNLVHLQGHRTLKVLDLGETNVSDECAAVFSTLPKLRLLFLNDTRISDRTLNEIAKLRELDALSLRNTSVSDEGVNLLMRLQNLEFVDLSGTFVTSECIKKLKKRFKGLDCIFAYGAKRLGV